MWQKYRLIGATAASSVGLELKAERDQAGRLTVQALYSLHSNEKLSTSPLKLKFSPDWDPAGDEFSRAATCFKLSEPDAMIPPSTLLPSACQGL